MLCWLSERSIGTGSFRRPIILLYSLGQFWADLEKKKNEDERRYTILINSASGYMES